MNSTKKKKRKIEPDTLLLMIQGIKKYFTKNSLILLFVLANKLITQKHKLRNKNKY